MKKIALFCSSVAVVYGVLGGGNVAKALIGPESLPLVPPAAVAAGAIAYVVNPLTNYNSNCSSGSLTYESFMGKSVQDPWDDEYLYLSSNDYKIAYENYKKHSNSGDGKGYECDTAGSRHCKTDDIVVMKPGHVFKGSTIGQAHRYKCQVDFKGNDYWEDLGVVQEKEQACKINGQEVKLGDHLHVSCKDGPTADIKTGHNCRVYCLKKTDKADKIYHVYGIVDCPKGYKPVNRAGFSSFSPLITDVLYAKCEKQGNDGGNNGGTKKTCKELYGKYPERLACCEAGKDTEWKGSLKDGTCSCVDKSKVWDSAKKQCITPEQNDNNEFSDCFYNYDVSIKCANGNTYHEKGSERLKKSQLADFTCEDFNSRFGTDVKKWQELYGDLCKDEAEPTIVITTPNNSKVEQAQNVLSAFTTSATEEASVWKTSEGKFNTTRLASDITAGVVLGTVGGVVTGNVIKKNQVKKGFEALHCTVGGQKVADWGDEFNVGLRR